MLRSQKFLLKPLAVAGPVLLPINANLWGTLQGRTPAILAVPWKRLRLREELNMQSTYLLPTSLLPLLKLSALLLAFLSSMPSTDFATFEIVVIICWAWNTFYKKVQSHVSAVRSMLSLVTQASISQALFKPDYPLTHIIRALRVNQV